MLETRPTSPLIDVLVVVVAQLHHLVADAIGPGAANERSPARVQRCLESLVERNGPGGAPVHGREHLHVADRVEPEPMRNAGGHELHDRVAGALGIAPLDDEEVGLGSRRRGDGRLAAVDAVSVGDDETTRSLPEDRSASARKERRPKR